MFGFLKRARSAQARREALRREVQQLGARLYRRALWAERHGDPERARIYRGLATSAALYTRTLPR
jgi:hypothetical protein